MSQQLPKGERQLINLSLTQPSKIPKNRSGTPTTVEGRRGSTPTKSDSGIPKKVLKVVLLDEHKKEKTSKIPKAMADNGHDNGSRTPQTEAKNGGASSDVTNGSGGKKSANGSNFEKPVKVKATVSEDVILIDDEEAAPKKTVRESSRQKSTPTRNDSKDDDGKKETSKAKSPRVVDKDTEEIQKIIGTPPATPPKKVDKKTEPSPKASSSKVSKKANKTENTTSEENTFKTFEDDEMESLMVETEATIQFDSPMPAKVLGKSPGGKVLRLSAGPPNRARISPFRRSERTATQQNASTIVNLSTVSEQSTEAKSTTASPAVELAAESSFGHSMRVISGRRTVRPINEICLTAYRQMNDSNSSMNATVGSEIHNDSFRTPVVPVIGRKRFQNESPYGSTERIEKETTDSPKRARFDLNGLMDFVASPVTMLRARLSRAKLQSTPKFEAKTEELDTSLDTSDIEKLIVPEITDVESAPVEGETSEKKVEPEQKEEKNNEDVVMLSDETKDVVKDMVTDAATTDDIVVTEVPARRACSIM